MRKSSRTGRKAVAKPDDLDHGSYNYDRAEKLLRFLLALNDDDIARVLVGHGFTSEDLDEGWQCLRGLSRKDVKGLTPARRNRFISRRSSAQRLCDSFCAA